MNIRNKPMTIFIENPKGSSQNYLYDEKSLSFIGTKDIVGAYPFPYGFIPGTKAPDGDCLDCFVITEQELKTGFKYEVIVIGMMEVWENNQEDHKILVRLIDEDAEIDEDKQISLRVFEEAIFSNIDDREMKVGSFLGKEEAEFYFKELSC